MRKQTKYFLFKKFFLLDLKEKMVLVDTLYYEDSHRIFYIINNNVFYRTLGLNQHRNLEQILLESHHVPAFNVDPNGSKVFSISWDNTFMLYQKVNGRFVELIPRDDDITEGGAYVSELSIPEPNGGIINSRYSELPLRGIEENVSEIIDNLRADSSYDDVLNILNRPVRINNLYYNSQQQILLYIINNRGYFTNFDPIEHISYEQLLQEPLSHVPSFNVDPNGSKVIVIYWNNATYMIYQKVNGIFIELIPRVGVPEGHTVFDEINIQDPNQEFPSILPLEEIDESVLMLVDNIRADSSYDDVLNLLNGITVNNLYVNLDQTVMFYIINNRGYYTGSNEIINESRYNELFPRSIHVPSFNVDTNESDLLSVYWDNAYMLYQKVNGRFIELVPRNNVPRGEVGWEILSIPTPNGQIVDDRYTGLLLHHIQDPLINIIDDLPENSSYDTVLNALNNPQIRINNLYYNRGEFFYIINHRGYYAGSNGLINDSTYNRIFPGSNSIESFNIDRNGSDLLAVYWDRVYMLYQKINGRYIELISRFGTPIGEVQYDVLLTLDPNGPIIDNRFTELQLEEITDPLSDILDVLPDDSRYDDVLNALNGERRNVLNISDYGEINKESYETLLKRLYNIPIILPEFLILENGIQANFISFDQLKTIQISSFKIDPLLQPWGESPKNIITIFSKDGNTYLIKAIYDKKSNQLFP